jgi:acyl-CoA oxidase
VWRWLLAERERRLHEQIGAGLRASRSTSDRFERMNEQAVAVAALADAHAHRLALDALLEAIEQVDGDSTRDVLRLVAGLYVLDHVARHAGWYLEQRVLRPAQAAEIGVEVNRACAALTPHARMLTDAFAIPDDVLRVPIASPDYISAWDLR